MENKKVVMASFTSGFGRVVYEDGTTEQMTYDEYIVKQRNFEYSSTAQLIRYLDEKGKFYYAGHRRSRRTVTVLDDATIIGLDSGVLTKQEYLKVAKLLSRYQRFYWYCKEVSPQWKEVDRIYYADNSIEAVQVSKFGEKRHVMVTGPHGDLCY